LDHVAACVAIEGTPVDDGLPDGFEAELRETVRAALAKMAR